ncbi:MAG: TetR/AcrR family transcriptional regulator [Vicinamibacterales bacterium]
MTQSRPVKIKSDTGALRPRGRPRSVSARVRVLKAARAILNTAGVGAVTVEAVAARSGVGKPTIYRTWPNAQAVVMAALMDAEPAPDAARRPGSAIVALRAQLRQIAETFASKTGRNVTLVLAAAEPETELSKAFRHHFILTRRDEGRTLVRAAMQAGDLRRELDVDTFLDCLYGPIFFRILVGHVAVDATFCDRLLNELLRGAANR